MPGSRRERAAVPALALRLQSAAQLPTPAPAPAEPPPVLARVLEERYPSGGGERPVPAGFYRPAPGEFDCDCGCCMYCTQGVLPLPHPDPAPTPPPPTRRAAPQAAQDGPANLALPPEVERRLAAPPAPAQRPPAKGPEWAGLDAPFTTLPPLAQIAMTLVQEAVASHGESAMTVGVAYKARRVAHVLLHGKEMPWQEGKG